MCVQQSSSTSFCKLSPAALPSVDLRLAGRDPGYHTLATSSRSGVGGEEPAPLPGCFTDLCSLHTGKYPNKDARHTRSRLTTPIWIPVRAPGNRVGWGQITQKQRVISKTTVINKTIPRSPFCSLCTSLPALGMCFHPFKKKRG